ncbi:MAG: S41 family peptidase [Bacteroidales bacterium]|nr:S41 family peptidase [Bacteroidales bacterium]
MDSGKKAATSGNIILILIAMVLGVIIGLMFDSHQPATTMDEHRSLQGKIGEVIGLVERQYVDSMDADSLSERLVSVMLSELDPHSSYLTAEESEETDEMIRGNFEGVGLSLRREGDTTFIGEVMADGPSEGSGLLPGDIVWSVDGVQVSGVKMPADSVVKMLRGPRRSKVDVAVRRTGSKELKHVTIQRGVVSRKTLLYSDLLDDTTGYIILNSFASTSHAEFHYALMDLVERGMRSLIVDLRGNTGGSLEAAVGIANEMLPAGSLIVYTQGAHQRRHNVIARRGGLFTKGKVIVMVDEGSASASEVVSGALQDNDRATIVGRRTFGKGLVQQEFDLSDGAALMLTVARYYTPSGRSIQRPYSAGTDEYYQDYLTQLMEESYADNPTLHVTDSTPYYTTGGRVVYGGGGIFPDRLIAYRHDPTFVYYNRLSAKHIPYRVAFNEVKRHAAEWLERYPTLDAFSRRFELSDGVVQRLVAMGEAEGVPLDRKGLNAQRRLIRTMLKAFIGESLYGPQAFYHIYLAEDEDLRQARAIMKEKEKIK